MNLQTLALAFLAAAAVGGLPGLHLSVAVGREKGRMPPRFHRAFRTRPARQAEKSQRSRREQVEGR